MKAGIRMRKCGFTLIEMLVVIAIIGVLMGVLLTAVRRVTETAKREKAREAVRQITSAWEGYLLEYRQFPSDDGFGGQILEMNTNACSILMGRKTGSVDNNRGDIKFLESSTNELSMFSVTSGMRDPWGGRYQVRLDNGNSDIAYDGKVKVNSTEVPKEVAVWSMGPDKINYTSDDITSWGR